MDIAAHAVEALLGLIHSAVLLVALACLLIPLIMI